jgi:hypothetical protein
MQVPYESVWLGATSRRTRGVWEWTNGEFWGYSNWDAKQWNDSSREYLAVSFQSGTANWHDAAGYEAIPYICEWGEEVFEGDLEAPNLQVTNSGDYWHPVIKVSWTQVTDAAGYYLYADFSDEDRPFDGTFEHVWDLGNAKEIQLEYDCRWGNYAYIAVRAYHQMIGPYSDVVRLDRCVFPSLYYSFIIGEITDALTGKPIEWATISALETLGYAVSLPDGAYSMIVEPGTWTVGAEAPGYKSVGKPGVVVNEFDAVTVDFALIPQDVLQPIIFSVDIKGNNHDDSVKVSSFIPVSVVGILTSVGRPDEMVDSWVAANSPFGFFFYSEQFGWHPDLLPYKQVSTSHTEEIKLENLFLPKGFYTFYLAVDDNADGRLDATWWDSVDLEVE